MHFKWPCINYIYYEIYHIDCVLLTFLNYTHLHQIPLSILDFVNMISIIYGFGCLIGMGSIFHICNIHHIRVIMEVWFGICALVVALNDVIIDKIRRKFRRRKLRRGEFRGREFRGRSKGFQACLLQHVSVVADSMHY